MKNILTTNVRAFPKTIMDIIYGSAKADLLLELKNNEITDTEAQP